MSLGHGAKIVRDGLVLYLDAANPKSYPGSGTTWYDLSGNNHHGTMLSGTTFDSEYGGAMSCDGTTNVGVNLTDHAAGILGLPEGTLQFFFKANSGSTEIALIGWRRGSDHDYRGSVMLGNFTSGYIDEAFSFGDIDATIFNGGLALCHRNESHYKYRDDTVHHGVVVCGNGGNHKIYIDGVDVNFEYRIGSSSTENFFMNAPGVDTIYLGKGLYGTHRQYWNGMIYSCQIYNRPLTSAEVKQNFNALRGRYGI